MRALGFGLWALAVMTLLSTPSHARRLPAPGGKVTVALPPELVQPTTDAHLYAPLFERAVDDDDIASAVARPPIPGFQEWRSSIVRTVHVEEGGRNWRLVVDAAPALVADAITRCLGKKNDGWAAAVLRARGAGVEVTPGPSDVRLRFSEPVGPVPELLAGCVLRPQQSAPTGSYALVGAGILAWRSGSLGPPPLLGMVELTAPNARADIIAGGSEVPGAATLLAPFPDVIVLLQSREARKRDALGFNDATVGVRGFRQALRADLLAAAYAQGRGTAADGLLPPGVAPARPLPEPQGPERLQPLSLAKLPSNAPRITVRRPEGDPLVDGVAERLAVILRNRGILSDLVRPEVQPLDNGIEILRWRPPTRDPALALLSLAGLRPELVDDEHAKRALADPRLLSASPEERVAAALALERAWLDGALAVPLLTADRWFIVDPDLRGVVVREDGVPLLFDAYFGGTR